LKVEEPPPIVSAGPRSGSRGVAPGNPSDDPPQHGQEAFGGATEEENPKDIAALHGIDDVDITPDMRRAFVGLLEEVAQLREALQRTEKRVEFLTELADRDSVSNLLNRRAFLRELSHALTLLTNDQSYGALAILHIDNLESIHKSRGMAIGDGVIEHAGAMLEGHLASGEVAGRIEGAAFGLILIGRTFDSARALTDGVAAALQAHPLVWRSVEIPISITVALHALVPGEDAGEALVATDRQLQGVEHLRGSHA
jgi:diguanylate cyclase (GGDEF)-like protein